mgnify:CR=1 FL=1
MVSNKNLLNATSIEQVGALTHLDVLRARRKHEARYAFTRFEFMHAVGQATHLFVQVVDFLIALVETTLQIQNSNDARKVDALTQLSSLISSRRSMSACEYMRVLPLVR